jgi:hypothetical protein
MSLKEQLAEYRAGWYKRVPAERQAIMQRHIDQLRGSIGRTMLKVGDRAPAIVLENANGATVDVGALGPYSACREAWEMPCRPSALISTMARSQLAASP